MASITANKWNNSYRKLPWTTGTTGRWNNKYSALLGFDIIKDGVLSSAASFSRASGGYTEVMVSNTELVTNGDFSAGITGWDLKGVGNVSGGVANFNGVGSNLIGETTASLGISAGKKYLISFAITAFSSGAVSLNLGGVAGTVRNLVGTYNEVITANSVTTLGIQARGGAGFVGSIDNISVREIVETGGTIVSTQAAVNQPRYRYVNGFKELLIEGAATNLVDNSTGGSWTALTGSVTLVANAGGESGQALRVQSSSAVGGAYGGAKLQNAPASQCTYSVRIKDNGGAGRLASVGFSGAPFGGGGDRTVTVNLDTWAITAPAAEFSNVSVSPPNANGWRTITFNFTPTAVAVANMILYGNTNADYLACCLNVTNSAFASSPILTTGSPATRAAELLSIPLSAIGWNASAGTFIFEGTVNDIAAGRIVSNRQATAPSFLEIASAKAGSWDGTTAISTANSLTAGQTIKAAVAFDGSGRSVCLNGGAVASGGALSYAGMTELQIGSAQTGTAPFLSGSIRNLPYFPRKFSNTEIQSGTL